MLGTLSDFFKFKIVDGTPFGKGIVATEKIVDGEIICKIAGPRMDLKQFTEKYELDGCNVLQIDEDLYIDVIEPYVYFNHSCNPNAGIRNDGILFALKTIDVGEQIFFDYSTTADDVLWKMECGCKQKNCRKTIGDFQTIPHDQKMFYLTKGALPRYIKRIYY